MRILQAVTLALGLGASAVSGGCLALAVGAAAGVGTYAYVKGEMETLFEANYERTWAAAEAAIKDLQFATHSAAKDALEGKIVARQADGTDVTIHVEPKGENLTEVRVRVGTFGDESESRLILDKIAARL